MESFHMYIVYVSKKCSVLPITPTLRVFWACKRCPVIQGSIMSSSEAPFAAAPTARQAEDMRAARQHLQSLGKQVSGLVGHSKAGSGVILYAAKYDDIPRVVNISGRFDNLRGARSGPRGSSSPVQAAAAAQATVVIHLSASEHSTALGHGVWCLGLRVARPHKPLEPLKP